MLNIIKDNIEKGKYNVDTEHPKKPEGFTYAHKDENGVRQFKDVYIYDENKSIKWNREYRENLVNNYYNEIDIFHNLCNQKELEFKKDLINALIEEYELTGNQAGNVYTRAWEDGHSDGLIQVVYEAIDYAEFARDILDNKKYY